MARDRKRAKQRQQRRSKAGTLPPATPTHHENVPGSLEHASGDVEEFDAALIAGADGEVAQDESILVPAVEPDEAELAEVEPGEVEPEEVELEETELAPEASDRRARAPDLDRLGDGRDPGAAGQTLTARRPSPPARGARGDGENRVLSFLKASWAELQRVQWPDRRQVAQATAVVLGFVAIAGAYLGIADWVAGKVVNAIL